MVIVQIHSGLGNQMFQYAAGRALAAKLGTSLKLDLTWFEKSASAQTPNDYQLNLFPGIKEEFASKQEIDDLIRPSSEGILNRLKHKLNRSKPLHKRWAFVEPQFHFYSDFFKASNPVYLSGYWQSEKYFGSISDEIRNIFSLDIPLDDDARKYLIQILQTNAVSLHVRRGDMVNNPLVVATHGSCNLDYYLSSMALIEREVENPHFYIFSDDVKWCEENLKSKHPITFVQGNSGERAYLDIQLMRNCSHHIIANSSFSWWGAWLNNSQNKVVVAPVKWFATDEKDTRDLIPPDWKRI